MQALSTVTDLTESLLYRRGGGAAPGWPGEHPHWAPGSKVGVGTARNRESRVWFTLAQGALTELYYPRIDTPNTRVLKFLVTDGKTFLHDETLDTHHRIERSHPRALAYRMINTDKKGRYRIVKEIVCNPHNDAALMHVRFEALAESDHGYQLYMYLDPHVNNSGWKDTGRCAFWAGHQVMVAGDQDISVALASSAKWSAWSTGYAGRTDGLADLRRNYRLAHEYDEAVDGNIAHIARIDLPPSGEFTVAVGFGRKPGEAAQAAVNSATASFEAVRDAYVAEWQAYCGSLNDLGGRATDLYYGSVMMIKALEDKQSQGAMVASLSIPWGEACGDENRGGYHLVWPRDLYHSAMALVAAGDLATAHHTVEYLATVLQRPDGSFPQNAWLDGKAYWEGIQLDQVAFPILLAWHLGRQDLYPSLVKRAADFLVRTGPATPQERWEECGGYSPSSLAAEIAALVCAAEMAAAAGDHHASRRYLEAADTWQERIEHWCVTRTGWHGTGRYYIRCSVDGCPDQGTPLDIANGGGVHDQRHIVDAGFLELVRLGIKPTDDPVIVDSLQAVDSTLKVETPKGPAWRRYNHDGYGETAEGMPYCGAGVGRLWPILTGERGHYELAAGGDVSRYVAAMERFANEGGLLPEQVWESTGEGTGGATPLAWSHAEYVRLLASMVAGRIVDLPEPVARRYGVPSRSILVA